MHATHIDSTQTVGGQLDVVITILSTRHFFLLHINSSAINRWLRFDPLLLSKTRVAIHEVYPLLTALLSDIHGNLEALNACLGHARERGAERFGFLGDLVGYGAEPDEEEVPRLRAIEELGLPQSPVTDALRDAVVWWTAVAVGEHPHVAGAAG